MSLSDNGIEKIYEEIQKPISDFNIRELILNTSPPFEWSTNNGSHPIEQLGYFCFGVGDGFRFDTQKVAEADELVLWKLYALIQTYWLAHYKIGIEDAEVTELEYVPALEVGF